MTVKVCFLHDVRLTKVGNVAGGLVTRPRQGVDSEDAANSGTRFFDHIILLDDIDGEGYEWSD